MTRSALQIFTAICLTVWVGLGSLQAQDEKVVPPEKVMEGFNKNYPNTTMIFSWRQLDDTYIATFTEQENYRYTRLNEKGWWVEEGVAVTRDEVPEGIWEVIPELDITAFVYETYRVKNDKDKKGYLIIYETAEERIDIFVLDNFKILRKNHYPIPAVEDPTPNPQPKASDADSVDWGGDW